VPHSETRASKIPGTVQRVALHGRGVFLRDEVFGSQIKTKTQYLVRTKQLLVAEIDAKVGGLGIVPEELAGAVVSSHYFTFEVDESVCTLNWLDVVCRSEYLVPKIAAKGSTNYASIRPTAFLELEIPLPSKPLQEELAAVVKVAQRTSEFAAALSEGAQAILQDLRAAAVAGVLGLAGSHESVSELA
jgi:type I restriction enzyme S subunit